jgi:RNA polymerase sigma-70 factor (ECF subfamily)
MVLRMKHIEGMEVEEIAAAVQMSIDAVYQNLSRARRSILEQFKKGAKL